MQPAINIPPPASDGPLFIEIWILVQIILRLTCTFPLVITLVYTVLRARRVLSCCKRENRRIGGAVVWLGLFPLVNIWALFFLVQRLDVSARDELYSRGELTDARVKYWKKTRRLGLTGCKMYAASHLPAIGIIFLIPAYIYFSRYSRSLRRRSKLDLKNSKKK